MKHEVLVALDTAELKEYARRLGIKVPNGMTKAAIVEMVEERRERSAEIEVLGVTVSVPIKRLHDKRVTDVLNSRDLTEEQLVEVFDSLVGDEKAKEIVDACTDEDGTLDVDAYAMCINHVIYNDKLKNF